MIGITFVLCLITATLEAPPDSLIDTTSALCDTHELTPAMKKVVRDPWFGQDKLMHFSAGFAIPGLTYHFYVCRLDRDEERGKVYAVSLTALAAFGKELYDLKKKKHFSWKDLAWGGLGLVAGYMLFVH